MVSKKDRLDPWSNFCKHSNASPCSFIVEAGQQVVADEGHGFRFLSILIQVGQAEGQIELELRTFAHLGIAKGMLDTLLRGVSTRNYKDVIPRMAETVGVSKSSVSRQAIEASEAEVEALLSRRLTD
jgi:hypothetical protein